MARIGFVGLGNMGLPMALNLLKAKHEVTGYDLQQAAVAKLCAAGGVAASSLAELSFEQDFIITMLQTGAQVLQIYEGEQGIMANAHKNSLIVDCSTIDIPCTHKFHSLALKHNFLSIDAPVSGGVAGAKSGSLTFMVGGNDVAFMKARPVLNDMGSKIIHTGGPGSGQAAKICNNMLLGISMIACAEAFLLGKKLGISEKKLHEVITSSSGQCWVMDKYVPVPGILDNVPANADYKPGFTIKMMLKDLNLSQVAAKNAEIVTILGSLAEQIYQKAQDNNHGELDFSAIILEKDI